MEAENSSRIKARPRVINKKETKASAGSRRNKEPANKGYRKPPKPPNNKGTMIIPISGERPNPADKPYPVKPPRIKKDPWARFMIFSRPRFKDMPNDKRPYIPPNRIPPKATCMIKVSSINNMRGCRQWAVGYRLQYFSYLSHPVSSGPST